MKTVGHQFEYLHGAPHERPHKNRLLKVPQEKIKKDGKHFLWLLFYIINFRVL